MKKILISLTTCALMGCVPITTRFTYNRTTGQVSWSNPKDSSFDELEIGTNYARIKGWKSSNNPQVISSAGQADALIAKTYGDEIIQGVQAGAGMVQTMGANAAANTVAQGLSAVANKVVPNRPIVNVPITVTNAP